MNFEKIETTMYLARINLFFTDEEYYFHDWRDAKVIRIEDDRVTLDVSFDQNVRYDEITYTLDELIDLCHELCEKHFSALKKLRS